MNNNDIQSIPSPASLWTYLPTYYNMLLEKLLMSYKFATSPLISNLRRKQIFDVAFFTFFLMPITITNSTPTPDWPFYTYYTIRFEQLRYNFAASPWTDNILRKELYNIAIFVFFMSIAIANSTSTHHTECFYSMQASTKSSMIDIKFTCTSVYSHVLQCHT